MIIINNRKMDNSSNTPAATFENVWAALLETDRILTEKFAETDRKFAETDRKLAENNRILTEKFAETDRILTEKFAETDRKMAKTDQQISNLGKQIGGISKNHGDFVEEYFFNSFERGKQNFFGEKFDRILKNVPGLIVESEYDIVLINGESVAIIEAKFKMHMPTINDLIKKAKTFRINYPHYAGHRIYLGFAAMVSDKTIEQNCINNGIAVIKQVGDVVVICDDNIKAF